MEEAAVAIVEWGELAESIFGEDVVKVELRPDDADGRTISVGGALDDERHAALQRWSQA